MINSKTIDTEAAPIPRAAAVNARMRNIAGQSHFSTKEQNSIIRAEMAVNRCYSTDNIHANWRTGGTVRKLNKFAALKLETPVIKDKKELKIVENLWDTSKEFSRVDKRVSAQGIIYRFYF